MKPYKVAYKLGTMVAVVAMVPLFFMVDGWILALPLLLLALTCIMGGVIDQSERASSRAPVVSDKKPRFNSGDPAHSAERFSL